MQGLYENHRDGMTVAMAWYTRNNWFKPHFHNSIELAYVLEGELVVTLDGLERRVQAGELLINSSYTVHSYDTPASSYAIIATIPLSTVPTLRPKLAKQSFSLPVCADDEKHTLRELMRLFAAHSGKPLVTKGISYALLGLLVDRIGLAPARTDSRAAFIRDVLEYLQQHHTEPLSVEHIAAHFGYSRSRFSHLFNAHLGCTLPDYIGSIRCQHAAQLLRETDLPVVDVAMAAGFDSPRTFYRTFKRQYEMTPSQYGRR